MLDSISVFCLKYWLCSSLYFIYWFLLIFIISTLLFDDSHFLRKFITIVTEFLMLSCRLISTFYSVIFVRVTFVDIIHKAGCWIFAAFPLLQVVWSIRRVTLSFFTYLWLCIVLCLVVAIETLFRFVFLTVWVTS